MVNWCCRYYNHQETGFYYLQTRYYDPAICRFINADAFATTDIDGLLSTNMFSYCENNPVMGSDPTGEMVWWAAAALGGAAFEVASYLIGNAISGNKSTWKGAAKAALSGAITGVAFGAVGKGVQAVSKAAKAAKAAKSVGKAGGKAIASEGAAAGKGFNSFSQLKKEIGSPGAGNEWHHIVEQNQIGKSGFSPQMVHNTNNIMAIDKTTHSAISGYYSSKQPFTNGMRVREWLVGQSFDAQYEFGLNVVKMFT